MNFSMNGIQNKEKIRSFVTQQRCLYWSKRDVYISLIVLDSEYMPYLVFMSLFYHIIFIACLFFYCFS